MIDNHWDCSYKLNKNLSVWPWSDLVSLLSKYEYLINPSRKLLEIGCGAGANINFLISKKFDYFGIEGSQFIVDKLLETFPELSRKIIKGDFCQEIEFDQTFDIIVDRASLTHNKTSDILRCLKILNCKMNDNSLFFGIDWFSKRHTYSSCGVEIDSHTRSNIEIGIFKDLGVVHFSDVNHLSELFSMAGFEIIFLSEKSNEIIISSDIKFNHCSFNLIARKTKSI